jgi:chitinase
MFGHLRVCNGARLAALTFLLLRIASPADAAFNIGGRDDKSQNLQRKACPYSCGSDPQPNNWTTYHETDRFTLCEQPLLLDFAVYNPIDNPGTDLTIRACCAGEGVDNLAGSSSLLLPAFHQSGRFSKRDNLTSECGPSTQSLETVYTISWGSVDSGKKDDVVIASQHVRQYFDGKSSCTTGIMFGYVRGVVVGVYAGAKIGNRGAASSLLQNFIDRIQVEGIATSMLAQLCGNDRDSENVFGIIADSTGNFPFVQEAVKSWSDAKCVQGGDATREWEHIQIWSSPTKSTNKTANAANATHPLLHSRELMSRRSHSYAHGHANMHAHDARQLSPRADCRTEKVESGNSCGSLATKCGISGADFTKYNPSSTFCSTLQPGQLVCCSAGTIPDIRPKPDANGSCASYDVQPGDFCQKIASSNGLTLEALNSFNTKTWGWTGCENLQVGIRICLSTGTPPMPAPVANAVCGPTKPGTKAPTGSLQLADLNPCPLKVCCNIWGQCGTTTDFCVASNSSTGAPGTASPGTNGCIQNCGMDIINDKEPPASFSNIAYFEAWNGDRPCLHMDVGDIDTSVYTHVHYSFAEVTPSFQVDISKVTSQFDAFKAMTGIKRILAFGGWTFSTDPATYNIFRQAVTAKNRNTFADNCANFVLLHNLDGVDFDWEYPGAPDIPGIPPGNDDDGSNYLEFLKLVRSKLSSEKSLSIAAPASYWYLKAFPIEDIAKTVTYIVFMTYDLHG